ncbi:MAG: hypothetical protein WKF67_03490 [Rubrobacteraceae bacterium]|jgi:hypothetical protein
MRSSIPGAGFADHRLAGKPTAARRGEEAQFGSAAGSLGTVLDTELLDDVLNVARYWP